MSPITIILTVFITLFLTACGGSGSPASTADTPSTDTGDGSGASPDPSTPGAITNISFGSGVGDDFIPGAITLNSKYSLVAGSLKVSVSVVDNDAGNAVVPQAYQYEFNSTCSSRSPAEANFSVKKIGSSTGTASTTYRNISCRGSDTLTVVLLSQDGTQQLATATANIPAYIPQLGFGNGAEYIDEKIDGESVLLDATSTILTANAVDTANINQLISSETYTAVWRSSCAVSSFSITSQTLSSGDLVTRYDANSCVGTDTISLTIYSTDNLQLPLDSISMNMQIGSVVDNAVVPALSDLTISNDYVLAGSSLEVSVKGIDSRTNELLSGEYLYQFTSTCPIGTGEFENTLVETANAEVDNVYASKNCVTNNDAILAVNLFESGADVASDAPLHTISTTFKTAFPQLGFGSGADFIAGKIEGNTNLVDEASTKLTVNAVDVLNLNSLINSGNYVAQWSAGCPAATFSIDSQSLSTSSIVTRYDANTCTGNDTVMVKLFAKNDLATELNSTSISLTVSSSAGVTVDAKLTDIVLSNDHALAGESLVVSINGIDVQNDNEALIDNYVYRFTQSCAGTAFEQVSIQSNTGTVSNTYHNTSCGAVGSSATDTLTVELFEASDLTFTAPLDTKAVIINTSYPKLGFGSGADFIAGKIEGNTNLVDEASTKLTVNAVDVLNLNSLINSGNYVAQWSAGCPAATFSIDSQSLSTSSIVTRYDANTCTGNDTVTVKLFAKNDLATELNSTSISLTVSSSAGVTVDAKLTDIVLSNDHALAGESLVVSINGIDVQNDSVALTDNYVYRFTQSCAGTAFEQASIQSNTGVVSNVYRNTSCANSSDILTVQLFEASDLTFTTPLDTKTVTINTAYPKLGFGNGAGYIDGLISGQTILVDTLSSMLSANAVDRLDLNRKIESDDYVVAWSSSCENSTFSIASQSLVTADIVTRYDAMTCTGTDIVTLSLYAKDDLVTVLNAISLTINIGDSAGVDVNPELGIGNGSDFSQGQLSLSSEYALAGGSVSIIVNGVNSKNNNALLEGNYLYKFESNCPADSTRFSSNVIASGNGVVSNTYVNRQCTIDDTITVSLFSEGVDTNTATPIATATASLKTALPKIGYGSGADFVLDTIEGNHNLVDDASTLLSVTIVDPLNVNTELQSANYYVEWSSTCATSAFSIESQNITSAIKTRYDGDANLCTTDTVTLTLFNKFDDELDSITADITISASLIPAEAVIGSGTGVSFDAGNITFSESNIAARQTIEVLVNIVDSKDSANTLITGTEYAVSFDSVCVKDGRSSLDRDQVRTTSGIARVYYTASGCTASDTISAVLYAIENNEVDLSTSLAVASASINIELPQVNSIEYKGMSSRQIALKGISFTALPEVTAVEFVIKDEFNEPISGKEVTFSLSNSSVDATLSGDLDGSGEVTGSTDASGIVTAYVNSGLTHGLVSVLASAEKNGGGVLRTQSFGISITTGIPVQPSLTLAIETRNPRGWDIVGETTNAVVYVADRFHNPVPDGTIINFTTDGGIIEPVCTTQKGTCSVVWTSANPRPGFNKDNSENALQMSKTLAEHPTNDPTSRFYFNRVSETDSSSLCGSDDSAEVCDPFRLVEVDSDWNGGRSGLVTILAYVEGEVDFADANGNGRYDDGESFSALSEAYLDANEDGKYTAPDENNPFEQLIEYVKDGVMTDAPDTYQGGSCTDDARKPVAEGGPGHCAGLVHLRKEAHLVMSSDNLNLKIESVTGAESGDLTAGECINVYSEGSVTFDLAVSDYNGNTPINETKVVVDAAGFTIDAQPAPTPNKATISAIRSAVTIRADKVPEGGFMRIRAEHPDSGEAGYVTVNNLTDDPFLRASTSDYLMDISTGPQIIELSFADACGKPPGDSDIMIIELSQAIMASFDKDDTIIVDPITNKKTSTATPTVRASRFQIFGNQLTEEGTFRMQISSPPAITQSEIMLVRTINRAAQGLETTSQFTVTYN